MPAKNFDVAIIGAGHNGLAASIILSQAGLSCVVLEGSESLGGATRTEYPFKKVPGLATSSASYLLGLMPPELYRRLGVQLPLIKRDPHYFLPTYDKRYLLLGQNEDSMKKQFVEFFSLQDFEANQSLVAEISALREDLAPSWLQEPLSVEETAERYIRPELREKFLRLVQEPIEHYLRTFNFKSDLLFSMYAVTDAFSGLNASFGTPGAGFNFLVHNMCRLPGSSGTFMMVKGGMGTVAKALTEKAISQGVTFLTHHRVRNVSKDKKIYVTLEPSGIEKEFQSNFIFFNCDPFTTLDLLQPNVPSDFVDKTNRMKRGGTTLKVNLALKALPKFKCLPENRGQFGTTIHLLPQEEDLKGKTLLEHIRSGYQDAISGKLPEFPTIEWYIHTPLDSSMQDSHGHHNSAFFVQWVPNELKDSSWDKEEARYVQHLLRIADRFAPGTSELVADTYTLTPPKIEKVLGIRGGHIHHVDNTLGFDKRFPYRLPVEGMYSCSAGTHPAGSVIAANGYNAANCLLKDLKIVR